MRLKKIAIRGFKSFADSTILEFQEGITGVVGPNGCGKSNVVDAFRWVLGEQSAKSMRGAKMHDVLFAGTTKRRPLNTAEVTLVLDNVNDALPTHFEEVAITRRLHRDGNSEYLINGKDARLRDVHALFFDSGIGKEAFSIFEQGKIEQVIHWTPTERRSLIEEAAGIVRFLHRKREALQKLEQAEQNLARANDVHQEVIQRLEVLEKQSAQASQYKALKQQLEELECAILSAKWQHAHAQHAVQQAAIQALNKQNAEQQQQRTELTTAHTADKNSLHKQEETLRQRRGELHSQRNERAIRQRDYTHNKTRQQELLTQQQQWQHELHTAAANASKHREEAVELQSKYTALQQAASEQHKVAQESKNVAQQQAQQLEGLRREQQIRHRAHLSASEAHSRLEGDIKRLQAKIESLQEQLSSLTPRNHQLQEQSLQAQQQLETKAAELAVLAEEIESQKNAIEAIEATITNHKMQLDAKSKAHEELRRNEAQLQARLKALEELKSSLEGVSEGCKRLLKASHDRKNPLYNKLKPLYEVLKINDGNLKPLSATLQRYTHTLVAETHDDVAATLTYAQQQRYGNLALIATADLNQASWEEHFQSQLHSVKTLEEAYLYRKNNPQSEIWIEEQGVWIDRHGVLFTAQQGEGNAFSREAAIEILKVQIANLATQITAATAEIRALQEQQSQLQAEKITLDKAMRAKEMKHIEANHALLRCQEEIRRYQKEKEHLAGEDTRLRTAIASFEQQHSSLQNNCTAAATERDTAATSAATYTQQIDQATQALKQTQEQADACDRTWRSASMEERQSAHAIEMNTLKQQEGHQRIKQLELEIERITAGLQQLQEQQQNVEQSSTQLQQTIEQLETACSQLAAGVTAAKEQLQAREAQLLQLDSSAKELEEQRQQHTLQASQLATTLENLASTFNERYETDINAHVEATPLENPAEITTAERRCRSLRQELTSCGDVNLAAIEECAAARERHAFLSSQVEDLTNARQQLLDIIGDLDGQSRQRFQDTFNAIRTSFQKNFALLFEGGEADLQLVDSNDILAAGIEITAKPPGKQMRSLTLLSGGEKCLTAMALLFAIFEIKPAPYCILDEIDAPLDDTNVDRFARVVQQFADRCQFIIVTHNKRTMAIANRIYGVSMQEKGVSRLIVMEFDKAEAPVARAV